VTSPIRADLVPTVSWTNAAFEAGGVAALSRGLAEFQAGSLAGQSRVGSTLGANKISRAVYGAGMWSAASGIAQANVVDQAGFDRVSGVMEGSTLFGLATAEAQKEVLDKWKYKTVKDAKANLIAHTVGSGKGWVNQETAFWAGEISSQKTLGDLEAFEMVSQKYGGPEAFQKMLSQKNYLALGQAIEEYAMLRGISYEQAAREMGNILGRMEGINVSAQGKYLDTVGDKTAEQTKVYNALSDAARAMMLFRFAQTLEYAKSEEDFEGIFKAQKSQFSEMSFTLNEEAAKRLNAILKAQGYKNANFQAGDRVSLAIDEKGNITVAKGVRGAEKFVIDRKHIEKGLLTHTYNVRKDEQYTYINHLNRKLYGTETIHKSNVISEHIKKSVVLNEEEYFPYRVYKGIGYDSQGNPYVVEYYYAKDKDGKTKIVAGSFRNVIEYEKVDTYGLDAWSLKVPQQPVLARGIMGPNNEILQETKIGGQSVKMDYSTAITSGIETRGWVNQYIRDNFGDSAAVSHAKGRELLNEINLVMGLFKKF
jgi:hypothetical protein